MKITIFTGNQPRHLSLIRKLATIADKVYAIQECTTIFPGQIEDFYKKSDTMKEYFSHVCSAERFVFGEPWFLPNTVKQLAIKAGDLNQVKLSSLNEALDSDYYVVFGSSFIKKPLCDFLIDHKAYNIHMGISPYYRGSSCNFWALYDGRPDMVGATIHLLDRGLDSGPILRYVIPHQTKYDPYMADMSKFGPFVYGMNAVKKAHEVLTRLLYTGQIENLTPIIQNKDWEVRYTRNSDFTDRVARDYLNNLPTREYLINAIKKRNELLSYKQNFVDLK